MIRPAKADWQALAALLAASAVANFGYLAYPEPFQARAFRIGNALLVMVLAGLLVQYGPKWGTWLIGCLWTYFEALQSTVCRIASFDLPHPGGTMLCVTMVGKRPYDALLAASLAFIAVWATKPWPRP